MVSTRDRRALRPSPKTTTKTKSKTKIEKSTEGDCKLMERVAAQMKKRFPRHCYRPRVAIMPRWKPMRAE